MTPDRQLVSLVLLPDALASGWVEAGRVLCRDCTSGRVGGRPCLRCCGEGVLVCVVSTTRTEDPAQPRLWRA